MIIVLIAAVLFILWACVDAASDADDWRDGCVSDKHFSGNDHTRNP